MNTVWTPYGDKIVTSLYPQPENRSRVQAQGNASYEDFAATLISLGSKAMPGVLITEEDPKPDTETPVVTFEIVHETPVAGEAKARIRQTVPSYKCAKQSKDLACGESGCSNFPYWVDTCGKQVYPVSASRFEPEGESTVIWGQRFNTVVQFNCWGKTTPEAGALATRFKRFMFIYTGVFKLQGVAEIMFLERLRDRTVLKWRDDIWARSLRYRFTFEELYLQEYAVMRKIAVGLADSMRQIVEPNVTYFSARISVR